MKNKYLVFVIQAYEEETDGRLTDVCEMQLIAENIDTAIDRAKKLIVKKNYRLSTIIEKYHE